MQQPIILRRISENQKGYFLIELAAVISVIGLLLGLAYPFFGIYKQRNAAAITQKNIEAVSKAFSAYAQTRWRLPCPANPELITKEQYGVERSSCDTNSSDAYGIIPHRTLGIPEQYIRDGYGNSFTYVVSPNFTYDNRLGVQLDRVNARLAHLVGGDENEDENSNDDGYFALLPKAQFCAPLKNNGTDIVINYDGVQLFSTIERSTKNVPRPTNPNPNLNREEHLTTVVMAIISHGSNRRGSYQLDGSQFPLGPIGSAEEITSNNTNRIVAVKSKRYNVGIEEYDDTIMFYTQDDIYALGNNSCEYL